MINLLFFAMTKGPVALTKYRLETDTKWKRWAVQFSSKENELHQGMDPGVAAILKGKKICLLEKIASSSNWPDKDVFRDIAEGVGLVGIPEMTGISLSSSSMCQ